MTAWWTDNYLGVWLGVGHAAIVVLVGIGCAWFIYHGQRRREVTRVLAAMSIFGALALAASLIALLQGQHFRVWYPLLMMGGISVALWIPNLIALDWLYRRHDTRRLAASPPRNCAGASVSL